MAGRESPLLHGQQTGTPLDRITNYLFFVWPITKQQVDWLNTPVYTRYPFWINYWSLTHVGWGMLWALLGWATGRPQLFGGWTLLVVHTLFELWELWAGGYLTGQPGKSGQRALTFEELVDVAMDTVFAMVGFFIVRSLLTNKRAA